MRRPFKGRFSRTKGRWSNSVAATGWGESTFAEQAWDKSRGAATRWAIGGALLGGIVALIAFAPAAWLASRVADATDQRLLLADARGTIWSGSAVPVLTGGPDSRDAAALPGRIEWTLAWKGLWFDLQARHACCLNGAVTLQLRPGLGRMSVTIPPPADGWIAQWPSAWLGGLGTPFNTLELGGALRLGSPGLMVETFDGRWRMTGRADLDVMGASSRLSTLDFLGNYRLSISGDAGGSAPPQLSLSTMDGPLQLRGSGEWGAGGVRFRGEASAAPLNETALSNLLNIIGRRDGARSVISIG